MQGITGPMMTLHVKLSLKHGAGVGLLCMSFILLYGEVLGRWCIMKISDFSVGQVWRTREGVEVFIVDIDTSLKFPIRCRTAKTQFISYMQNGMFSPYNETPKDLVQLVVFTRKLR